MTSLHLDTETFCAVPIAHGAHRYAEDAEVIMVQVAWDAEPVDVWDTTDQAEWPRRAARLQKMVDDADEVVIHNSAFDRTVLRHRGVIIPPEKIVDTMVIALQHSLPGSLDKLCDVLGVPTDKAKDKEGKKLIQLFCKPLAKNRKLARATRDTHPEEWARFLEYGRLDIEAMREVRKRLPVWNCTPSERELWLLDQEANDRGVQVDLELAHAAIRAFDRASQELAARASRLTGGAVGSLTQRAKLLQYFEEVHDYRPADLTKGTVSAEAKKAEGDVRELLEIRQQAAATTPAKYKVLVNSVSADNRLRGLIQFCGAPRTGRDCLAQGAPVRVMTPTGEVAEKAIETVTVADLVWDGEEWVTHDGVVFSGEKEVIEYDSVVATPEHVVYLSSTEHTTLGNAKEKGLNLWAGNSTQFTE